jgi:hypothetical protein
MSLSGDGGPSGKDWPRRDLSRVSLLIWVSNAAFFLARGARHSFAARVMLGISSLPLHIRQIRDKRT